MGRVIEFQPRRQQLSYEDGLATIYNALLDSQSILQVFAEQGDTYFIREADKAKEALEIFVEMFM